MTPDEPTDVMPGGPDEPTEALPGGSDEPTAALPGERDGPTDVLVEGDEAPTEPMGRGPAAPGAPPAAPAATRAGAGGDRNRGLLVLAISILASLLLAGAYLAAGGPIGPDATADPCDARPWTDPGNLEEAAQQFALSAADGAACELGVSREELTRSIADDGSRRAFMERHGLTEADLEDALRAGLNRAVDDAESAGALGGLAASAIRAAIKVMPMSVMIGLLENADGVFSGDLGSLGGIGDALDAITGGLDGLGSGGSGGLGDALEGVLPEGTTDGLDGMVPDGTRKELERQAKDALKKGLDDLLGP